MSQTVLVTGVSGFIAAHVVDAFLRRGYRVRGTVRSEKAASDVIQLHSEYAGQLSISVVPNMTALHAFDEAVKGVDGEHYPYLKPFRHITPASRESSSPARLQQSWIQVRVRDLATSTVKVIGTQSLPKQGVSNGVIAYLAWKTFAERAAWDYVEGKKPNFTVTTLLPPMVYGPVLHNVSDAKALNNSSADIYRLIDGSEKEVPVNRFWGVADVRDVAEAHVLAFEKPAAAGQRHLISNGAYSYQQVCDIIREKFPQLRGLTPEENPGTPLPSTYRLDTSKAIKQLGINFRSLEETIVGTVDSLLKVQKVAQ